MKCPRCDAPGCYAVIDREPEGVLLSCCRVNIPRDEYQAAAAAHAGQVSAAQNERRATELTPEAVYAALTSKQGAEKMSQAIAAHHKSSAIPPSVVRDAVVKLFATAPAKRKAR